MRLRLHIAPVALIALLVLGLAGLHVLAAWRQIEHTVGTIIQETFLVLAVFAFLALGLLALYQRPHDLRAKLLSLLSIAIAVDLLLPIDLVASPTVATTLSAISLVLTGLLFGLELHLASVIPEPQRWLERHRWVVPGYYLVGVGLGLAAAATALAAAFRVELFPWTYPQVDLLLVEIGRLLWASAVILLLARPALHHPLPAGRRQAALVLVGVLPWAAYVLVHSVLELAGSSMPGWTESLEPLLLLCLPLAIFTAIFRFELFDLRLVVRRGLVYTTLTAALVLVFYAAVGFGTALLSRWMEAEGSVWVIAGATLLLGLLFSPLRAVTQRLIDRSFFLEQAQLRRELIKLASELPSLGALPSMGQKLVAELRSMFELRSANLLLTEPETGLLRLLAASGGEGGGTPLLAPATSDPAIELLRRVRRPLSIGQLAREGSGLAAWTARLEASIVLPILQNDDLVGLLLLGEKESAKRFGADELELLSLLSHQVATVFDNVRLFESATRDSLTGLLRREAALEELQREIRRALRFQRPLTVAMADLDHFKRINDEFGHLAGDMMLRAVAKALTEELRSTDVVGRYGGEEFLIVLPETDLPGAIQVADKVLRRIKSLRVPGGARTMSTSLSVGLASIDELTPDRRILGDELLATADRRLYQAKDQGRDRIEPRQIPLSWRSPPAAATD